MTTQPYPERLKGAPKLSPPENHRQTIVRTFNELADERQSAAEREDAIIRLIDETTSLTGSPHAMSTAGAERIVRRPDRITVAINPDVKNTQWPRVFARAIENPTYERWLNALKTTAVQTASTDGVHSDETAALLTAIIHAMEPEEDHSAFNSRSLIDLSAAIGRSRIEQWQAPKWWPKMIQKAAIVAMDRTIQYVDESIPNGNQGVFRYNTQGMLLPTTRKMNSLEQADYLLKVAQLSNDMTQDTERINRFQDAIRPVKQEWWEGVMRRFPERILCDDYNYHTMDWPTTSPDARETILQTMSSISERYPNAERETDQRLAEISPRQDSGYHDPAESRARQNDLESIRTTLRQTHPEDIVKLAARIEQEDRYGDNIMGVLSTVAMYLCRPKPERRSVQEDPLLLATIGRMLRTSHIGARQSREIGSYDVTTQHLQDAKEITAVIPIGTVSHAQRERVVANIEQQIADIENISNLPNE